MKFAKTYIETLASSHFPDEWKRGAVDYKQLKKLIRGVVDELESLGLGADVLKDLLVPPAEELSTASPPAHDEAALPKNTTAITLNDHEHPPAPDAQPTVHQRRGSAATVSTFFDESPAEQWIETLPHSRSSTFDADRDRRHSAAATSPDAPVTSPDSLAPPALGGPAEGSTKHRRKSSFGNQPKTPADLMRTHDTLMRRAESASSSGSGSGSGSATADRALSPGPGSSSAAGDGLNRRRSSARRSNSIDVGKTHFDSEGRRWLNGKDGRRARAEYELGGTQEHPVPRIRLLIESPMASDEEDDNDDDSEDTDGFDEQHFSEPIATLPHRSPVRSFTADTVGPAKPSNDSPVTLRGRPVDSPAGSLISRTPVITTAGVAADQSQAAAAAAAEAEGGLEALPEAALDADSNFLDPRERRRRRGRHHSPSTGKRFRRREIVIPLTADTEFLESLTSALQNLSRIQEQQREHFVAATENLCSSIARVASPYATPNDMYVWREIFALWVDSQIFESSREKDRGELSPEESEARLKKFAEELAKRGWIAREAHISEDADEVAAAEAEQALGSGSGDAADANGSKKRSKKPGFLLRRHGPHLHHSSNAPSKTMTMPDGTVAHVSQHAHTQSALDDFLKLNVELLDVKKFQAVNVEAARKILKKHDKRTALTAAQDLRTFMAFQERDQRERLARLGLGSSGAVAASSSGDGLSLVGADRLNLMEINGGIAPRPLKDAPHALPLADFDALSLAQGSRQLTTTTTTHPSLAALLPTSATGLMGGSLPHILLSLVTTTLLPILPSIDESSCVICTSVAWRPVRLACGHLFCIRCLVKLQRARRDDCPLCRHPAAVKMANAGNLDEAMGNLLKTYFPEEVKVKQQENDDEVAAEEVKELGLEKTDCVIC